jgi:hypothetical protein
MVAAALCLVGALAWLFVDPERALEKSSLRAKAARSYST